jgi:hypothetical protein
MTLFSSWKQLKATTKWQDDKWKEKESGETSGNGIHKDITVKSTVTFVQPNHVKVTLLMDAAESHSNKGDGAIGIKFLKLRSVHQWKDLPRQDIYLLSNAIQIDWIELKQLANS